MERSIYSAMCFVENLKRRNVLRDVEVTVLENWYDWCLKNANIGTDLIGMYVYIYIYMIYGFYEKLLCYKMYLILSHLYSYFYLYLFK